MHLSEFLQHFPDAIQRGDQWECLCPAHQDDKASLHLAEGADGKILVNCKAGCKVHEICHSLGMTVSSLFPDRNGHAGKIVATYDYHDDAGALVFQVVRRGRFALLKTDHG